MTWSVPHNQVAVEPRPVAANRLSRPVEWALGKTHSVCGCGGGGEKGVLTVSIDSLLVVSDTGTSRPTKRRARTGGKSSGIGHLRTDPQGEEQEQTHRAKSKNRWEIIRYRSPENRPTGRRARTGGKSSGIGHLRTDPQGEEQEQTHRAKSKNRWEIIRYRSPENRPTGRRARTGGKSSGIGHLRTDPQGEEQEQTHRAKSKNRWEIIRYRSPENRPTGRRARTGGKSSGIGHLRTDPQGEEQEQVGNHQCEARTYCSLGSGISASQCKSQQVSATNYSPAINMATLIHCD
ncbi:hypothetical protein RRG08_000748 [Elysia crispata]|uniref:Uncharacterized protein n=1 Tax=Elysia crispata TaxID=231223 RepID=A0AAE1CQG3_9GAST|nr:hypothetical protein RRG08_000748 [Elysia crispata]